MLRFHLLALTLLASLALGATANEGRVGWAEALFESTSRDFGAVARGQLLNYPFRVTNSTSATIRIANVRVSCGCTSAYAAQTTLAPGEETAVVVQMDTRRFASSKTVTVYVQFDQPRFEEVRLWVRANSRDDVFVTPEVLKFGPVRQGSAPSAAAKVTFVDAATAIKDISCESNYIEPSIQQVSHDGGSIVYEIAAKVRNDAPPGKWFTEVWLTTDNPVIPRVRVPLTIDVEKPAAVQTQTILLGKVKAGTPVERQLTVRGPQPFRITDIRITDSRGGDDAVHVRDQETDRSTEHTLVMSIHPTRGGDLSRTIRVETDLPDAAAIIFTALVTVED